MQKAEFTELSLQRFGGFRSCPAAGRGKHRTPCTPDKGAHFLAQTLSCCLVEAIEWRGSANQQGYARTRRITKQPVPAISGLCELLRSNLGKGCSGLDPLRMRR